MCREWKFGAVANFILEVGKSNGYFFYFNLSGLLVGVDNFKLNQSNPDKKAVLMRYLHTYFVRTNGQQHANYESSGEITLLAAQMMIIERCWFMNLVSHLHFLV